MSNRVQRHSYRLSYLLRHSPESGNLVLDSQGWVSVEAVLTSTGMSREDLQAAVEQNDKNRFELDPVRDSIRARQGHSVEVDLGLEPVAPPAVLYHGTVRDALPALFASGLLPMSRQYVHLSSSVAVAENVAGRRSQGESMLLLIDAAGLAAAGIPIYCSTNGVYLASTVPPQFLSEGEW